MRDDIIALLGLEQPQVLVAGFDRPNIYLRVERVEDEEEKDARLPHLVRGRRALVYAATRKSAEAAASVLNASGVQASAYHAGLKDEERTRVQDAFAARRAAGRLRDQRVRDGHRSAGRRRRRPLRDPRIARGVLPGDRPRRPRRARGDGDAAVGPRRRRDARVPDRQPAARSTRNARATRAIPRRSRAERRSSIASCGG